MKLNTLKSAAGSTRDRKRIGRGQGSGHGGTSTRGQKGAGSRAGNKTRRGFEGGQMPLQRRLPKRGFKNVNRRDFEAYSLDKIQHYINKFNVDTFSFDLLRQNKIVGQDSRLKVLGNGKLEKKVNVVAHAVSGSAKKAIEAAGGTVTIIS